MDVTCGLSVTQTVKQEYVCVHVWIFLETKEGGGTLPPHLFPSPTHPSSLLPCHSFHYYDNRIWKDALVLLSE